LAKVFTPAEQFYIREHVDKSDIKAIAKTLGTTVTRVKQFLKSIANAKPAPAPAKKEAFVKQGGSVSMTGSQSLEDDIAGGTSPFEKGEQSTKKSSYLKRLGKSIHVIDPSKPIQ